MSGILAGILLNAGAPILTEIIRRKVGNGPAKVADAVVGTLAKRLNVEPTEEAIVEAQRTDPAVFIDAVQQVETDMAPIWASHLDLLLADATSGDRFQRYWRPFVGWLFGLCCLMIVGTVCAAILMQTPLSAALLPLVGLVVPVMTIMGGVTGYYMNRRTHEKMVGD